MVIQGYISITVEFVCYIEQKVVGVDALRCDMKKESEQNLVESCHK